MSKMKFTTSVTYGGVQRKKEVTITGDGALTRDPEVTAAKTGSLSTRTDNDTGVIAAQSGHGIISTDKVDVFWDGGSRANMTATVSTNNISVDGGTGDSLPAESTNVTLMKPASEAFALTGDDIKALLFYCDVAARVTIFDGSSVLASFGIDAKEAYHWNDQDGSDNPLAGVIPTAAKFSHADSTAARTTELTALFN